MDPDTGTDTSKTEPDPNHCLEVSVKTIINIINKQKFKFIFCYTFSMYCTSLTVTKCYMLSGQLNIGDISIPATG